MVVLCIGGLDPSAGAGILADARVVADLGARPMCVATAWTAQSSGGMSAWGALPADAVRRQIDELRADVPIAIVKVGMLGSGEVARAVRESFATSGLPVVLDPVLAASLGGSLGESGVVEELRAWLPALRAITPNLAEAHALVGSSDGPSADTLDAESAARALGKRGAQIVVVTGSETAVDVFCEGGNVRRLTGARVETAHVHGTGCRFATSLAVYLAQGIDAFRAAHLAKDYVRRQIAASQLLGRGPLRSAP